MSGVNIACNIGNQMGHGAGEMKFDITTKDPVNLATCIAAEVVNDILENALDIATMGDVASLARNTIAFAVDDGVCTFPKQLLSKSQEVEEVVGEEGDDRQSPQIKDIIDGLNAIHVPNQNAEEPVRLDVEMKRLLNEMMSPPYEIINYEAIPRKDGVGDQPVEDLKDDEEYANKSEDCLVDADKIKVVEKKTRVTDLVMNSKQILTELLMSEETRNKQAEWEENNETVLQVIELDCVKPEEGESFKLKHLKEKSDVTFAPVAQEECLVSIDLGKKDEIKVKTPRNDDYPEDDASLAGSSFSRTSDEINKEKFKNKFDNLRKKWNINFKFFAFGKRKQKAKEEKANL